MVRTKKFRFTFSSVSVKTTVAYRRSDAVSWIESKGRMMKRFGDQLKIGMCLYWRRNDSNAHTLGVCLGKSVLVCDLESMKVLPPKLKNLLRQSKIYASNHSLKRDKLNSLGVQFERAVAVKKKFKALCSSMIKDRGIPKSKNKRIFSYRALHAATAEAYFCFLHGLKA